MRSCLSATVFAAAVLFGPAVFAVEEPDFLATKAVLWFDASKPETILTNETGGVTNWISRDASARVARAADAAKLPVYEATNKYVQTCVDFGDVGNGVDIRYTRLYYNYAFMCVKIRQSGNAFLVGDTGYFYIHRGNNGTWMYQSTSFTKIKSAWQDASPVTDLLNTRIPEDDFYVLTFKTTTTCPTDSLTNDRNISSRSGGRQLSEFILVKDSLTDDQIEEVSLYLLRKWKLERKKKLPPSVVIQGLPVERGVVSPDYGTYTNFVAGETYTFTAPDVVYNDSKTYKVDRTGWTFVKTDYSSESGTDGEVSFVHGDNTTHSLFTWYWTVLQRVPFDYGKILLGGYRQLEYVEAGSNGFINTGILLSTNTTDVVFTVGASTNADYTADTRWLGNFQSSADKGKATFCFARTWDCWRLLDSNCGFASPSLYKSARKPMTVALTMGMWYFTDPDSETKYTTYAMNDCSGKNASTVPIGLFAQHGNVTSGSSPVGARIYRLEVYEGTTCVHKLVPAQRRRDDAVGFYDLPAGKFYTNTAGTLVSGPKVPRPRGFSVFFENP